MSEVNGPTEEMKQKWQEFLKGVDAAAKDVGLVALVVSGAIGEKIEGEDKTKLVALGAALLPNSVDVNAVRDLSVMLAKTAANACANEAGRVAAASVAAANAAAPAADEPPVPAADEAAAA